MDEQVLRRLAAAVLDARGDRSQREFATLLGVAQSTIQSWENAKNTPSLENLEKLAKIRNQLPEDFVAYLYGRSAHSLATEQIKAKIAVMGCAGLADLTRAIADRLTNCDRR